MPGTNIVQRDTISAIIDNRDRALEQAKQGIELLRKADLSYRAASLDGGLGLYRGMHHSDWYVFDGDSDYSERRMNDFLSKIRKNIDQACWRRLINASGITNLMDATLEAELRKQLRDEPPEVSENAMVSTLEDLYAQRDETFRQAIVNLFGRLSNGYTSHSPFSIGRRLILKNCIVHHGQCLHQFDRDELSDLDRMIHIVQSITPPGKENDLGALVQASVSSQRNTAENKDFLIRIFYGNGNLHIYLKNPQLIRKLNEILTEHFGETLPCNHSYG